MNATPRPWHENNRGFICGPSDEGIAAMTWGSQTTIEQKIANSALIVSAVNFHDSLVAENARLREALEGLSAQCEPNDGCTCAYCSAINAARASLERKGA